ncbi:MAG: hypothetical protein M2R45_04701 [Verrucomicrobia subdivision 3 bacterium]|nr:hypothetical protein [Limisphaerales bacterium]MCS1416276.1 hypothetical protein [Limisphaerales bacterium]
MARKGSRLPPIAYCGPFIGSRHTNRPWRSVLCLPNGKPLPARTGRGGRLLCGHSGETLGEQILRLRCSQRQMAGLCMQITSLVFPTTVNMSLSDTRSRDIRSLQPPYPSQPDSGSMGTRKMDPENRLVSWDAPATLAQGFHETAHIFISN